MRCVLVAEHDQVSEQPRSLRDAILASCTVDSCAASRTYGSNGKANSLWQLACVARLCCAKV